MTGPCIFIMMVRLLVTLKAEIAQWQANLEARGTSTPLQPLIYWDFSKSNDAAILGEPHSKLKVMEDMPEDWFWSMDCHVVIRLPYGRVIDSPASSLTAQVENGRVVSLSFLTSPRRFCADNIRTEMVWNIQRLHVRNGADELNAIRAVDKYVTEATAFRYASAQGFGSRDNDGGPSVDIRLSGNDDEWGFDLGYELYWGH